MQLAAMEQLVQQLRFAPAETIRRQIERAEQMCQQIEPARHYPEDWVVYGITGYRAALDSPALFVGSALLSDLSILVETLSEGLEIPLESLWSERDIDDAGGAKPKHPMDSPGSEWLDATELSAKWGVSRKSLDRYRRLGLPAWRVVAKRGRTRLLFRRQSIEAFERRHADQLQGGRAFSRIDAPTRAKMIRLASAYRERLGWSLNRTAQRLAERFGRSHEAVRRLLFDHDRLLEDANRHGSESQEIVPLGDAPVAGVPSAEHGVDVSADGPGSKAADRSLEPASAPGRRERSAPIFDDPSPLREPERRRIHEAFARGSSVADLAEEFGKTRAAIHRILALERAARLRSLSFPGGSTGISEGAAEPRSDALESSFVKESLGRPGARMLAELMDEAASHVAAPQAERAQAIAYFALVARAAQWAGALSKHHPSPGVLDRIETSLRWASRVKAELVRSQIPLLLKTIQSRLGVPITELGTQAAKALLPIMIAELVAAVDQYDPAKGGRVAAPVGLALNRVVARWAKVHGFADAHKGGAPGRASRMLDPRAFQLDDWTMHVNPWQQFLEPPALVRTRLPLAAERERSLLIMRFGWEGRPPVTIQEAAAALGMTVHHTVALERRTILTLAGTVYAERTQ